MSRLPCLLNYRGNHLIIVIKTLGFSVDYIKNSQGDLIRREYLFAYMWIF